MIIFMNKFINMKKYDLICTILKQVRLLYWFYSDIRYKSERKFNQIVNLKTIVEFSCFIYKWSRLKKNIQLIP